MHVSVHRTPAALPGAFDTMLQGLGRESLFASAGWLDNYARNGMPPGDRLRIYTLEDAGQPLALLTGVRSRLYSLHPKARVLYFHQPDGLDLAPLTVAGGPSTSEALSHFIDHVRRGPERYDVVRFGPMDPDSPLFGHVITQLRSQGFLVQTYFNHPNWHAHVAGMSAEDFLRRRSRDFRRSIRRRERRLAERGDVNFQILTRPEQVETAIGDYFQVFAMRARHLQEEPLPPAYIPGCMHAAARVGALRFGVVYVNAAPAAYQYCVVSGGVAYFTRTGYDARFGKLGVGKQVIFGVLAHVLDEDRVKVVDFGIGDHEYKSDWVDDRRERHGIAGYNPRTLLGLKNAGLHMGAARMKPPLKRLRDRVLRWLP